MMRRDLAIKVLLPELGGKEEFARRFEREAESASRLTHPNIITTTDFGRTADGALFLVMEFLAGESLSAAISAGPMPQARALAIQRQILRALEHAHAAGIVHRDLKPENIMLVERDGPARRGEGPRLRHRQGDAAAVGGEALTQAGVIFGTPEYLSPEQALGEAVDARADIYGSGVILYEMLAGRRPFENEDKVKIISMHLAHAPPRIRDVNPTVDVPLPLEQAIMQALEKSREHRFATATAFLQALDDAEAPAESSGDLGRTHLAARSSEPARRPAGAAARDGRARRPHRARARGRRPGRGRHRLREDGTAATRRRSSPRRQAGTAPAGHGGPLQAGRGLARGRQPRVRAPGAGAGAVGAAPGWRVRYMLGRVAFADDKHQEALAHYREAIALDAGFRGDPVLLSPRRHAARRAAPDGRGAGPDDREDRRARG
jgi:hypothetical protein